MLPWLSVITSIISHFTDFFYFFVISYKHLLLSFKKKNDLTPVLMFEYCVNVNEAEAILLAFQHYLVMLGTTVLIPSFLVPQMGGGKVRI